LSDSFLNLADLFNYEMKSQNGIAFIKIALYFFLNYGLTTQDLYLEQDLLQLRIMNYLENLEKILQRPFKNLTDQTHEYLRFLRDFILERSYLRFVQEFYAVVKKILPRLKSRI
jgi:hypothetical protein